MATRDLQESFLSGKDYPNISGTFLPPFPSEGRILQALPGLVPAQLCTSKTGFLRWAHFTLEYPDEIWEVHHDYSKRIFHYLSFIGEERRTPAFVVEVCCLDEFTEVMDYSLITRESDLGRLHSGELVYSLAEELEKENMVRDLNERALAKYDEERLDEAEQLIDRAVRLSVSACAYLFNNRGLIHWKMGKIELAKKDFLQSIELDEENGDPYFNLGLIYFDEADFDKTLNYLAAAVAISPMDSQFLTELGHLYLEMDREKEAMELFEKALENNPDDPQVDFHLGYYFLYKKNKPRKAVKFYGTGLLKDPEDQFALADLAVAHWVLGNKRKTLGISRILEGNARLMPYAVSRLVYLNMEIGNYENALKYYRQALSHSEPFEPEWLHYNAALVYAKTGRPDQALDTLSLAVRVGGEPVIRRALSDESLKALKGNSAFKKLVRLTACRRNGR